MLWLHLQILLAANDLKGALELAQAEGYPGGGVGRTHWRMEAVREIVSRYRSESAGASGEEAEAEAKKVAAGEVKGYGELLRQDSDMCV